MKLRSILAILLLPHMAFGVGNITLRWKLPPLPFPPPHTAAETYGTGTNIAGNTTLQWIVFIHADVPRPMALVVHIGEFKEGVPGPLAVCRDLYYAGYNSAAIQYRLADPGHEMRASHGNQPVNDHGNYPEQTNDLSTAIIAARAGSTTATAGQVTGKVVAVGGSAGGSHVAMFAGGTVHGGDKLDAAVSLSGAYDLHDPLSLPPACGTNYGNDVRNYVGNCTAGNLACEGNGGLLDQASPYHQFGPTSAPFYIVATNLDPMPPNQWTLMKNLLTSVGATFQSRLITDPAFDPSNGCTRHAFQYWHAVPPTWTNQTQTDSIAFLKTYVPTP